METQAASFRESGAGAGVVCIHSSASSSGQWRPLMDRLANRFRVFAVDLYGYGQSPPWPDDHELSLADEVRLLEPVFRAAGERSRDPEQPAAREIASVRDDTDATVDRGDLAQSAERFVDYWMGAGAWAN